jgi:hypothetical protein
MMTAIGFGFQIPIPVIPVNPIAWKIDNENEW